jgi:SAM-dependent methyltransferase
MSDRDGEEDWPQALFVEHPDLFLPFLEEREDVAEGEVQVIADLMDQHGLPPGGRILDVCCGIGRHDVPLAQRGFRVCGVDLSPVHIDRARVRAAAAGVEERCLFAVGDMRRITEVAGDWGPFDVVLNLYTSMGYYGEAADADLLAQLAGLASDAGLLILEMANRDWLMKHFQAQGVGRAGDVLVLEDREFDPERSHMVNRWTYYRADGDDWRHVAEFAIDHRVYSAHELKRLVGSAGWEVEAVHAGYELEPIAERFADSNRLLLVATKA